MIMHNPPHPGMVVKKALVNCTGMTVTEAANLLDVSRLTLSNLIHGKTGISPMMAVRLSIVLNTSSEMWMNMQAMYDLANAERQRRKLKLKPLKKVVNG